jgi:MYXO-CTERM domain-containing protein
VSRRAQADLGAPLGALALALSLSAPAAAAEFGGSRSIYLGPQWPVAQTFDSQLGFDVALSAQRAAIGAPYGELTTGSDLGAVLLYEIGDDSLSAQVEVFGPAPGIRFGSRVDLEGDVLAVSAFGNDAVYIYRDVDDVWTIEAGLSQALFPRFGRAIDLSPDGETLLVGAIYPAARGRVFVYRHNAGTWTADAPPLVAPPVGGHFGAALSRAGDLVAIGSPVEDPQGAVYFAREVDGAFTLDPNPLLPSGAPAILEFGGALALTDDGLLAVGAPGSDGDAGAVLVYRDDGADYWDLLAIHTPDQGLAPRFGASVAFVEGALVVGAPAEGSGVAYVINDPGVADGPPWIALANEFLVAGNLLGMRVATRGRRVLVGAPATMAGIDGDAKAYELLYAVGSPCVLDTECTKGACVDGVCCDGPCDGPCERCSTEAGAAQDGICGPLLCPGEQLCVDADDACGDPPATETGTDTGAGSSAGTSATSGGQVGLEPWEGGCACTLDDDRAPSGGALALLVLSVGLGLRRRPSARA